MGSFGAFVAAPNGRTNAAGPAGHCSVNDPLVGSVTDNSIRVPEDRQDVDPSIGAQDSAAARVSIT